MGSSEAESWKKNTSGKNRHRGSKIFSSSNTPGDMRSWRNEEDLSLEGPKGCNRKKTLGSDAQSHVVRGHSRTKPPAKIRSDADNRSPAFNQRNLSGGRETRKRPSKGRGAGYKRDHSNPRKETEN